MKGKRMLALAGGAVAVLLAAMGISFVGDALVGENAASTPARNADLIDRGAYLAKLGDCAACHSTPGRGAR
jgi:mono/diheme cytochrome c family protein